MSAIEAKKTAGATSIPIDELFHEAMRSYEKALKSGIQLQEESVKHWRDFLTKLGSPEEFQAKVESLRADALPQARQRMEEYVEAFNRTSHRVLDIFENQATWVSDIQRRGQDLIETSLRTLRSSVQGVVDTNSKIFDSWSETVVRFVKPSK